MRKRANARFCVFTEGFHEAVKTRKHHYKNESGHRSRRHPPVNEQKIVDRVRSLAQPLCDSEGLELVQVEFQRESNGRILRLYIDKPDGIILSDCVGVSRQMGDILDVHLEGVGPYNLEVTSPGPERPLAKKQDFEKFKGNRAKIKTSRPRDGQKNFTGVLLGISGEQVSLQIGEQIIAIPYEDISKARLAKS
ncbi:MAG: ribosome maturation factor RimP [Desulfobacterales bacterium]|nr:ribosome maturation factor RimP [Desulfobacterales bacterium]